MFQDTESRRRFVVEVDYGLDISQMLVDMGISFASKLTTTSCFSKGEVARTVSVTMGVFVLERVITPRAIINRFLQLDITLSNTMEMLTLVRQYPELRMDHDMTAALSSFSMEGRAVHSYISGTGQRGVFHVRDISRPLRVGTIVPFLFK